ncbi:hypothetical protein CBER1_09473 [Cercospora berteroae]|uniref:SUR7 protein n=1 Tax=Cercospora berteroae TaxID=357750 RepID=A0A2S6CNS9_9PEZI|nr:hypothetical protein CBER1_09473 [Cercospora berteroae]
MRFFAIVPILLLTAALVLTFLGLFAGHRESFLQDYEVLNLNISQLGLKSVQTVSSAGTSEFGQAVNELPADVRTLVEQNANSALQALGLPQFYNAHVLTWCEGEYEPNAEAENAKKNFTHCSKEQAGYSFDPREEIQATLDDAGFSDVKVKDLGWWPQSLDDALDLVKPITRAAFILFVAECVVIFVCLFSAVVAFFASGRVSACCNIFFNLLAFLISAAISSLMTALVVVGKAAINEYGSDYGVHASGGHKFLALSWAATACLLVTALAWCIDCCIPRHKKQPVVEKYIE